MRFLLLTLGCALVALGAVLLVYEIRKAVVRPQEGDDVHVEYVVAGGASIGLGIACLTT